MDRLGSFVVCCEETGHFGCPGGAGPKLQTPADSESDTPMSSAVLEATLVCAQLQYALSRVALPRPGMSPKRGDWLVKPLKLLGGSLVFW